MLFHRRTDHIVPYYEQEELWGRDLLGIPEERERITSTIELIPFNVRTILDVGCGNGAFLNSLPDKYQAIGLDFSRKALKYVNTKVILGNVATLPFKSRSIDLVTCLEVLEHLPYELFKKAISEIQRVSKKYIIISVPNNEDIKGGFVTCPECGCEFSPHRHLRSFSMNSMSMLFSEFKLLDKKYCGIRKQYIMKFYLKRIGRFLGLIESFSKMALCPQCGFYKAKNNISNNNQEIRKNNIMSLIKYLIPYRKDHGWLIALYLRNEFLCKK